MELFICRIFRNATMINTKEFKKEPVLEDIMIELFDEYIRLILASIFVEDP